MSMTSKVGGGSRASDEDTKTSVKVAVRIRPPLRPTDPNFELIPQRFQRSVVQNPSPTNISIESPQGRKLFVFDKVFGEDVNQEGVWDYLAESIRSFVQGYNVSMLAYGQSGAGKSYTMGTSGPEQQADSTAMGVIPRAAAALFEHLEGPKVVQKGSIPGLRAPSRYSVQMPPPLLKASEKTWSLKATYLEIYNETLRDLLVPDSVPAHERGAVTIREDVKGHILLTGLRQVDINSVEDLLNALNHGSMIRQTDATAVNAKSSRSHAVFSLNLVQHTIKTQASSSISPDKRFSVSLEAMNGSEGSVTIDSKLHFVDLAGSERLKNTGAQGERAREGISINAGLAALGKVISQLSRNSGSHVSYRDSKLTRLLQDSLGGNAITYMIACVTPAEFHSSETLNTVQYAQRARAIQSKPQIQQTSDDGDKQALIDRLKAEVAFLREQIHSTEHGDNSRNGHNPSENSDENIKRVVGLQNQLLDLQENYSALGQRHAKLISEMTKARDQELLENSAYEASLGESATERLKRSNSFAEAVEKVVLEYETTIQSLEQTLSTTRGSLASSEANLLERETKCAYVETMNTQLQARLQKMIDREASTETYLHDLEARLDGHSSGEEKNSAVVAELRKETARLRENEASCEDYISTLEERLAEADQDAELMQREIDRLEHVVERQRSLGKLDNLLYELDHIQKDDSTVTGKRDAIERSRSQKINGRGFPDGNISERGVEHGLEVGKNTFHRPAEGPLDHGEAIDEGEEAADRADYIPTSLAQSKFVADKLQETTQELLDLRVEHEATVSEFEQLSGRYEDALRTLAELQDTIDETRRPAKNRDSSLSVDPSGTMPQSFLADARVKELKVGPLSSSRSLSSELSLAGGLPSPLDSSDATTAEKRFELGMMTNGLHYEETLAVEVQELKKLAAEKEQAQAILAEKYAQLEEQHLDTLDLVEDLKTEVCKARSNEGLLVSPVIRRKSSQSVMIIDRAHRSFASLRNIAAENFEDNPDVMQNFEVNLNTAMHELHARSERVQELEADIATVKKEMETKMTLISGLTRERSSMKNSPTMDLSVVSTMRDQLERNELEMRGLQESCASRERELSAEIASLQLRLGEVSKAAASDTSRPLSAQDLTEKQQRIADLELELSRWEGKHQTALEAMQVSEKGLLNTITELENRLTSASLMKNSAGAENSDFLETLQRDLEEHKASVSASAARIAELEEAYAATREELDEAVEMRDATATELSDHRELVSRLEQQIAEHENIVKTHQEGLALLKANHARDIEEMESATWAEHEALVAELISEHQATTEALQNALAKARGQLGKLASRVTHAVGVEVSVDRLEERISSLLADGTALHAEKQKNAKLEANLSSLVAAKETLMKDFEAVKAELANLIANTEQGNKIKAENASVSDQLSILKAELSELEKKNKKNSRLVEELEDQLASNFDSHQAANNRLSSLQSERNSQLEEANAAALKAQTELDAIKEEYAMLQAKFEDVQPVEGPAAKRSNSNSNQILKKSASVTSLPSPPPIIPLPPLPGSIAGTMGTAIPASNGSAPPSARPTSKEVALLQIQQDQEARIRTIEKHLFAEKQLTSTLEEALTDLERQSNKLKTDCDAWRRRASELEQEVKELREKPVEESRWSIHQVEEERKKRKDAEIARAHLEERMNAINKKKKKGSLNCF